METALRELIKSKNISNQSVIEILENYGYTKLAEIQVKDLKKIQEEIGNVDKQI